MMDTAVSQTYGGHMSDTQKGNDPTPDDTERPGELPPDAFSPVIDPDFAPDAPGATPEEKRAREHPEETGS